MSSVPMHSKGFPTHSEGHWNGNRRLPPSLNRTKRSQGSVSGGPQTTGFTFIEILVATVFLAIALMSLIWTNFSSRHVAMDSYFEFMAVSIAKEPLEVFRGFGYDWLENYKNGKIAAPANSVLSTMPLGKWYSLKTEPAGLYPAEAAQFKRFVTVSAPITVGKIIAFRVKVEVAPAQQTRVESWLSRNKVTLQTLVLKGSL